MSEEENVPHIEPTPLQEPTNNPEDLGEEHAANIAAENEAAVSAPVEQHHSGLSEPTTGEPLPASGRYSDENKDV